jgi:hypothetical protein
MMITLVVTWSGCDTERNIADPNEKYYMKYIGGAGSQRGVDLVRSVDGSIYILGNSGSGLSQQLYVTRTTAKGVVEWVRVLGGVNMLDDARDIEMLRTGQSLAILATVSSDASGALKDFVIRTIDLDGNMMDSVTYGTPFYNEDAISFTETADSYIVSGSSDEVPPANAMLVRFYKDLTLYSNVWNPEVGATQDVDVAVKTFEVGSNFYVFGYSNRPETGQATADAVLDYNVFIWVLGTTGVFRNDFIIGNRLFPNANVNLKIDERLTSVAAAPALSGSGFILTGYSVNSSANEQAIFAIKVKQDIDRGDPNDIKNTVLQYNPRTDSSSKSSISTSTVSVYPSEGSGFFILGGDNQSGNENIYLKKLANNLKEAWSTPESFLFGGVGNDMPGAVVETSPDGRILVVGTMVLGEATGQQKIVLLKLSPNGKLGE